MRKIPLIIALISLFTFGLRAQDTSGYYVKYTIHGIEDQKAWLCEIIGKNVIPIDSAEVKDDTFIFEKDSMLDPGLYKIYIHEYQYLDIIINNEKVVIETKADDVIMSMNVIESDENKMMFDYVKLSFELNDSIEKIRQLGRQIYSENGGQQTKELDELQNRAYNLELQKFQKAYTYAYYYPNMFVGKLLWAYQKPDYNIYLTFGGAPYPTQEEYYKKHFFDRVDFGDPRLLRSEVVFVMVNGYVQRYAKPVSTKKYIEVVDTVLKYASVHPETYQYVLDLFIKNFEVSVWEKVFVYLIEEHYLKSETADPYLKRAYKQRADAIKRLIPGEKAPDICGFTVEGDSICLDSIDSKFTLLLFWSQDCEHCEEMLPGIIDVYNDYKEADFEIYAFTFADDKEKLAADLKEFGIEWVNVSDFEGMLSEIANLYNINYTPTMILLDEEKRILDKPSTVPQLFAKLATRIGN